MTIFVEIPLRYSCGLIPLPGFAKLHTGSGMTKVDFYYAQMTSGVWGQWLSLCQVYRTAFRSRDIICDKIYGLKVGLHCFKELQFIGQSETMEKKILFVDPQWRPIRNVLLWQQQLSRWLVNSLRAGTPACMLVLHTRKKRWRRLINSRQVTTYLSRKIQSKCKFGLFYIS